MIQAYFLMLHANAKFSPTVIMHFLFTEMIKYNLSLTVAKMQDNTQIKLATNAIPTNKDESKSFSLSQTTCAQLDSSLTSLSDAT